MMRRCAGVKEVVGRREMVLVDGFWVIGFGLLRD